MRRDIRDLNATCFESCVSFLGEQRRHGLLIDPVVIALGLHIGQSVGNHTYQVAMLFVQINEHLPNSHLVGAIVYALQMHFFNLPLAEIYQALLPAATNAGVTDIDALLAGAAQPQDKNPDGAFELHRIGDAVASRNIAAAVYDALRLCSTL